MKADICNNFWLPDISHGTCFCYPWFPWQQLNAYGWLLETQPSTKLFLFYLFNKVVWIVYQMHLYYNYQHLFVISQTSGNYLEWYFNVNTICKRWDVNRNKKIFTQLRCQWNLGQFRYLNEWCHMAYMWLSKWLLAYYQHSVIALNKTSNYRGFSHQCDQIKLHEVDGHLVSGLTAHRPTEHCMRL